MIAGDITMRRRGLDAAAGEAPDVLTLAQVFWISARKIFNLDKQLMRIAERLRLLAAALNWRLGTHLSRATTPARLPEAKLYVRHRSDSGGGVLPPREKILPPAASSIMVTGRIE